MILRLTKGSRTDQEETIDWQTIAFKLMREGHYKRLYQALAPAPLYGPGRGQSRLQERTNWHWRPLSHGVSNGQGGVLARLPAEGTEPTRGKAPLDGTPVNLSAPDFVSRLLPTRAGNSPVPDEPGEFARLLRPDEIPTPSTWTETSFHSHIVSLIGTASTSQTDLFKYEARENHDSILVQRLKALFLDPNLQPYRSAEALQLTLHTFIQISRLDAIRDVFIGMELQGVVLDLATFNRLMQVAAINKDPQAFHYCLFLMKKRDLYPDETSWKHFRECISEKAWNQFQERLQLAGLSPSPQDDVDGTDSTSVDQAPPVEGAETRTMGHSETDHRPRTNRTSLPMKRLTGEIRMLCWQGKDDEAIELLRRTCEEAGSPPSIIGLNLLLNRCRKLRRPGVAMDLMTYTLGKWPNIQLTEATMNYLWQMAQNSHLPNVSRVLWVNACFRQQATSAMRRSLVELLASFGDNESHSKQKKWVIALLTISMRERGREHLQTLLVRRDSARNEVAAAVRLGDLKEMSERERVWQGRLHVLAKELVYADIGHFLAEAAPRPLGDTLATAFKRDREIVNGHVLKTLPWMEVSSLLMPVEDILELSYGA